MKMRVSRPLEGSGHQWRYVQPETGVVFKGMAYPFVRDAVIKHRANMGIPFNEEDFQDELCRQNTSIPCSGRPPTKGRRLTLADIKRFFLSLISWDGTFVSQEEAERRVDICIACPNNVHVSGCKGCGGVLRLAKEKLAGRSTPKDNALESCRICGCFNSVSVWIPLKSQNTDGLEFPDHCWKKHQD